ncbi:MAG: MATE family efflux transporter, partial [Lachnospiraceae bacterium]|nr:MATE family efflux transporter [Lachnospiraceae bacterium]
RLYFISNLFVGFNIILATYFSSVEKNLPAHILTLLRGFVIIIPISFIMARLFNMTGVWLACPITELITAIIGFVLYKIYGKIG